jgi:hypothetical protein
MALAATYLVAWDYDRLKPILFGKRSVKASFLPLEFVWMPLLFGLGGAFAASFFAFFRVANMHQRYVPILVLLSVAGTVFGFLIAVHHRFMKTGELIKRQEIL